MAEQAAAGGMMATEKLSRRGLAILVAFALARIGFGFQLQTIGSLGPQLRSLFGLDYAALGALIGVYMLPGAFVALPLGLLGRRFGDHLLVGLGLALMAIGGAVAASSSDVRGIGLGRMVSGVGAVAMQGKIIADWFAGRFFLLAISISVGAFPIGLGLGQLIQPPLANALGWHAPFWAGAAIMAVATLLFVTSFRPAPGVAAIPRRFSLPSGREVLLVLVAGAVWAAYTAGYSSYVYYLPSLMAARGDGLAATGLAMAIATWGNVPGTIIGGALVHRFGGLRIFLVGTLALIVGMLGTGLTGLAVSWAVIVGLLGSVHGGVIIALGTLSARPEHRAVGMSLFYTVYYGGNTVGPGFCGWAADRLGDPAGAMLAAALISSAALPVYLLHRQLIPHASLLARA
jgi:predicted MFS family arabinose efflux permease